MSDFQWKCSLRKYLSRWIGFFQSGFCNSTWGIPHIHQNFCKLGSHHWYHDHHHDDDEDDNDEDDDNDNDDDAHLRWRWGGRG